MNKGAYLSKCRKYRYSLWRIWDETKAPILFILLNPSTADEAVDDPTIRRCIGFAKEWGAGGIVVVNLFAFRATSPDEMMAVDDPIGPLNDRTILKVAGAASIAICAWGNSGNHLGRSSSLKRIMVDKGVELFCLGTNNSGEPKHPLYIKSGTKLKQY